MTVLGIDLSLMRTGLATPDRCWSVTTDASKPKGERLFGLYSAIEAAVDCGTVDLVVIEDYSRGSIARREEAGEVGGVARMALWLSKVPYVLIPPARLKKYACGGQKVRDKDAMLMAAVKAGAIVSNNDEADAYFLMDLGLVALGLRVTALAYRQQVVDAVDWPSIVVPS